jgi:hypothetical protein
MKKLLLILLVLGGAVIGGSYLMTGRLPWETLSPESQQVLELREEFNLVRQQWKQAGRAGSIGGVDTGSITEVPLEKLERLESALAVLLPKLKTTEARVQAAGLRKEIATFKSEMR